MNRREQGWTWSGAFERIASAHGGSVFGGCFGERFFRLKCPEKHPRMGAGCSAVWLSIHCQEKECVMLSLLWLDEIHVQVYLCRRAGGDDR